MTGYSPSTPASELQARIGKLQEAIGKKGVDGALIVQKTDLFYLSGTAQQGWLYVPVTGEPLLMIFKDFQRAKDESALNNIFSLASPKKIPEVLAERGYTQLKTLGMELDVLPVNLFRQYQKIFHDSDIVDLSLDIRLIRAVKSPYELELMQQAAVFSDQVAAQVPRLLTVGKTEVALAGEIEGFARSLGHQGIVRMRLWGSELFYGHLMSGPSAAVPSYLASPTGGDGVSPLIGQGAGFKKIAVDEPILVDYVFAWKGYLSDHTRIFCVGTLPDELLRAHDAMLAIQDDIRTFARPGVVTGEIYERMLSFAEKENLSDYFMGAGDRKIRFTGHGIGLELDEFPFIAKGQQLVLEEGMIIALEPKVIVPGKGVVGIENTHVVRADGLEALTKIADNITFI